MALPPPLAMRAAPTACLSRLLIGELIALPMRLRRQPLVMRCILWKLHGCSAQPKGLSGTNAPSSARPLTLPITTSSPKTETKDVGTLELFEIRRESVVPHLAREKAGRSTRQFALLSEALSVLKTRLRLVLSLSLQNQPPGTHALFSDPASAELLLLRDGQLKRRVSLRPWRQKRPSCPPHPPLLRARDLLL